MTTTYTRKVEQANYLPTDKRSLHGSRWVGLVFRTVRDDAGKTVSRDVVHTTARKTSFEAAVNASKSALAQFRI